MKEVRMYIAPSGEDYTPYLLRQVPTLVTWNLFICQRKKAHSKKSRLKRRNPRKMLLTA